ncbi:TPA: restriction endonuclease subunit S [Bacillus toyonensis]|nr:restriction endonuclease subunit S [Bacillus toyonensis]
MSDKFPLVELNVIVNVIDSLHKTPNYSEQGYPMVRVTDIKGGYLNLHNTLKVSKSVFEEFSKKHLPKQGDIVMSRVGTYGVVSYVNTSNKFCLGQNTIVINPTECDNKFLFYALQAPIVKEQIEAQAGGSTQKTISLKSIRALKIPNPSFEKQRKIGELLGDIDDQIFINSSINKTLEEMAKVLYKHWFVDFGPFQDDEFVESDLGLIPNEWEVRKLSDIANINMGQSPKSEFYNSIGEGLPFHQGVKDFGPRFPQHITFSSKILKVAEAGDILFSVRAPVGRINIAPSKMVIGRGLATLSSLNNTNSFLLYTLKYIFKEENSHGSGTIFNSINKTELANIKIVVPPKNIMLQFEKIVCEWDNLYQLNSITNLKLQEAREYLLPRLISGEIEVKEAAKITKEVLTNG